jgi:ketosteroid isomerase-like protein
MTLHKGLVLTLAAAMATLSSEAVAQHEAHQAPGDSTAVAAIVVKFHAALAAGDSAAALALLGDDAVILESGGVETRAEYRSHHLRSDIQYEQAVKIDRGPIRVRIHGDVAWTSSTSQAQGEMNGRPVNSRSAELMVMVRTPGGWKISAIHWSSQRRAG